ncbi:hypothetical protein ES288_A05G311500v1, partial [Gossypium darwinii]
VHSAIQRGLPVVLAKAQKLITLSKTIPSFNTFFNLELRLCYRKQLQLLWPQLTRPGFTFKEKETSQQLIGIEQSEFRIKPHTRAIFGA